MKFSYGVHDVRSLTRKDIETLITTNGGFLVREHYPFGVAPTYRWKRNKGAILFDGCLHVYPLSEVFPETIKAILRTDWMYLDRDRTWFQQNIGERPAGGAQ